ncbi:MAG: hypothetical protein AAF600_11945 [Bacteroidota bacterium]
MKQEGKWKALKEHKREFVLGKWAFPKARKYEIDTSLFEAPEDSLEWAVQALAKRGSFEKVQELYEAYGQYDSAYLEYFSKIDSPQYRPAELAEKFQTKERLQKYLPEELKAQSDQSIADQLKYGKLDQLGNIQKVDRSRVKAFFQKVDPGAFSKSQLSLKAAKKKYAVLPNLNKEEEGIKRNSLKGTPMKKRFFLNGNVAIQSTDPIIIDANLQLGYQWTKQFSTGVGLLYREQFNQRDSASSLTGDAHG